MRKLFLVIFLTLLVLLVVVPVTLAFLALSDEPLVEQGTVVVASDDAQRTNDILERYRRGANSGKPMAELKITEQEVASLLAFAARGLKSARVAVRMTPDGLDANLTIKLPANPIGRYANFSLGLLPSDKGIDISHVRVDKNDLPPRALIYILRYGFDALFGSDETKGMISTIQSVHFAEQKMTIAYRPSPGITIRLMAKINENEKLRVGDPERVQLYFARLQQTAQELRGGYVSLTRYIAPVFELAASRSTAGDEAAKIENEAAILALAIYFGDGRMGQVVSNIKGGARTGRFNVSIKRRHDLVQHYLTSAGLQIAAGENVANAIGEFKEIADTLSGGSGFSFSDIAADRAGVVFALQASDTKHARRIQAIMSQAASEDVFFPDIQGLPDNMSKAAFERRYGDVESALYKELLAEIERRIAAVPAYADG